MRACRRDAFGDSNTIVLAAVRPSEQLPLIGCRLPSAASSQAPSSGGALTQKHATKRSRWAQSVFQGGQPPPNSANPKSSPEPSVPALTFLSTLIMDILSA